MIIDPGRGVIDSLRVANALAVGAPPAGTKLAKIKSILVASAALNFASITADTADLTISVPGASLGDVVLADPTTNIVADIVWSAWVSAADVVSIRVANPTAVAVDLASQTWKVLVFCLQ